MLTRKHSKVHLIVPALATFALGFTAPLLLTGCDQETSTSKSSSSKVVDTPEGKKKVTETTETSTTVEKK